jgi:hypothetical protein
MEIELNRFLIKFKFQQTIAISKYSFINILLMIFFVINAV